MSLRKSPKMFMKGSLALLASVVLVGWTAGAPSAHAMGVSVVGDYAMANVAGVSGSSNASGTGGGVLLNLGHGHLGFEFGGIYSARGYTGTTANFIRVPALLAFNASVLHLAAGGYYAIASGSTAGFTSSDYGLEGAAGFHIPLAPTLKFVLEGHYVYGLVDQSATTATVNFRNTEVLAGLHFGI